MEQTHHIHHTATSHSVVPSPPVCSNLSGHTGRLLIRMTTSSLLIQSHYPKGAVPGKRHKHDDDMLTCFVRQSALTSSCSEKVSTDWLTKHVGVIAENSCKSDFWYIYRCVQLRDPWARQHCLFNIFMVAGGSIYYLDIL